MDFKEILGRHKEALIQKTVDEKAGLNPDTNLKDLFSDTCSTVIFLIPPRAAKLLCRLLLITMHVSGYCCFSDIDISQSSLATCLRCVDCFVITGNLLPSVPVNDV